MTGRSHVALAGALYLALALHPIETPLGLAAAPELKAGLFDRGAGLAAGLLVVIAAGLAPDIDKSGSRAARAGGVPTRLLAWTVERSLGHRGVCHSLAALLLAAALAGAVGRAIGVTDLGAVVGFGWGVHLLLDAMTARGVPLLWPLGWRVRLPPGLRTGGMIERVLVTLTLIACAYLAIAPT